jgi:UV DNA damage endonuclease
MSTQVKNASPSKTMTAAYFAGLPDREAAIRQLERIAAGNLHNTLRLLRHNKAHDIRLYRFSSKLIPLVGHAMLEGWNPIPTLVSEFAVIGDYVKANGMRVGFHPDHFTVLSTPREDVLAASIEDLRRHVQMLEAMGLDASAKCNIHVGGTYGNKQAAGLRFIRHFQTLPEAIRRRITLENDDKTFTAAETLDICETVGVPMVLDIHHHEMNNAGETIAELWPRVLQTWTDYSGDPDLPPKIHASSPKDEKSPRSHADYIEPQGFLAVLRSLAPMTPKLDVMLEAKRKDSALFQLMEDLQSVPDVKMIDQASFELG